MSTLILTTAQAAGQTLIDTGKRYAKSYVKRRIRNAFDDRVFEGPRLEAFHILGSHDGAPMARIYGRARIAGQVIWASRLKEHVTQDRVGGKGGPARKEYRYTISFAVGLCEGEILGVDRLWVNGKPLIVSGLNFRIYRGGEDQLPDPIISAIEGPDAPAFRGTAYMVFEDFPLDAYGARLPQINAEVLRMPESITDEPRLEDTVTGVNVLPASGEYAYASDIVEDVTGKPFPVNMNNLAGQSDIELALDQLETQLPQCRNISLIISWFGTDLRAGHCQIKPGAESRDRLTPGAPWQVCGQARETAYFVSQDGSGRPYYGGTPSDTSILQAIASFKARGFTVTLYPFILMDVPPGNGLPDPYGGSEQAAFPWRGRITSANDMSAAAETDVDAFFGSSVPSDFGVVGDHITYDGPLEFSFRRFILHYAKLAHIAGGVDRFVIGSEMRGLTTLRSAAGVYPSVSRLKALAADVRAVTGNATALTYAADWSEYFGHHDGADVNYHLDPLWSDPHIDAVGIDAYFPLSDWRDGPHLDAALAETVYDSAYLKANMEGGEGYDWYYATQADRDTQNRTPITDGAYDKPWVYRYKDIRNWWGRAHYNRTNGIEDSAPTGWIPESKPVWFTEIGCPAIDKGANQPNVFVDPKSSESHAPYYSSGTRDDLMQRRYIEAFLSYWQENNAVSSVDTRPMVDMDGAHIWCWDARPFPDFPARRDVWSDGVNWTVGHWLSGRTGLVPLREIIRELSRQSGAMSVDVSRVYGMVDGYVVDRPMSARAALSVLLTLYDVTLSETASGLVFTSNGRQSLIPLGLPDIVDDSPGPIEHITPDVSVQPVDVRVHYVDRARDYQISLASASGDRAESVHAIDIHVPIIMGEGQAKRLAQNLLSRVRSAGRIVDFKLSPARLDVEAGDLLSLPEQPGLWRAESIDGIGVRRVIASQVIDAGEDVKAGFTPAVAAAVPWVSKPVLTVLDIGGGERRSGVLVGAMAEPFNPVTLSGPDGDVVLDRPAAVGSLLTDLAQGPIGRWDYAAHFDVKIRGVDLSAVDHEALLNGANRFAVETEQGWEVLQAAHIELIGENEFRLSKLLRGQDGTDADMMATIPIGARIAYLNQGFISLPVSNARIGEAVTFTAEAAGRASDPSTQTYNARYLRPLSPVHGKAELIDGDLHISWIRRTREDGNSWAGLDVPIGEEQEFYQIELMSGNTGLAAVETTTSVHSVTASELATLGPISRILIRQGSLQYGYGAPLEIIANL